MCDGYCVVNAVGRMLIWFVLLGERLIEAASLAGCAVRESMDFLTSLKMMPDGSQG